MEYRNVGASGLEVSALSFGSWVTFGDQIDEQIAEDCMKAAWETGVNYFDNAEAYAGGRAESVMGSVLKRMAWKRSEVVISTKIFWAGKGPNQVGVSRKRLIEGTTASLARLQLDYVDMLLCHRPDSRTPIEETVRAMNYLINQGKALYWGTSWWSAKQLLSAYHIARRERLIPPTVEQPEYNMFAREWVESEYEGLYDELGLGLTTWSPLASGMLTGKYNEGIPPTSRVTLKGYEWLRKEFESGEGKARIEKVKKLAPIAKSLNCSLAQLALAWCAKNPRVSTVITGATRPEQVAENMKAIDVVPLITPQVIFEIENVLQNKLVPAKTYR
ncbi:MAG: aldo/keto reductase [Candidatus Hydrogenedentes bacterium]|nr:aldo/keto reductase [Candidatus Hydrogenedentota bacterium]